MNYLIDGNAMYIWQIKWGLIRYGSWEAYAKAVKEMGIKEVFVKMADGTSRYNLRPIMVGPIRVGWKDDILPPMIAAFRAEGIRIVGWHYVYGTYTSSESSAAIGRIKQFDLDAWIINAEVQYKNKWGQGTRYIGAIKAECPDIILALSTYRFPYYHLDFPWGDFLPNVDFNLPQVYWMGANNPAEQLEQCVTEFKKLEANNGWKHTPIYPTGSAFSQSGWIATPEEIIEFGEKAVEMGFTSVSWWELENATEHGLIDAVVEVGKMFGDDPPPPPVDDTLDKEFVVQCVSEYEVLINSAMVDLKSKLEME